ncbi:hypothetical protein TWF718_001147 [Orbilia javanica]|uniref:Nucleoside phosphorylase domain-containing protein n=1 Tax=Orbilia javanica TaxID=47235 RepID=A0AAN8RS79_9PEZI
MATGLRRSEYSVGWICAIPIELAAAVEVLDEIHKDPPPDIPVADNNAYKFGRIGRHNVVISCLPVYGVAQAAIVATQMRTTFTKLRFGLMVGVGGGAPKDNDIRLGDIVVSQPTGTSGGVIQYDFGKAMENGKFERIGSLNAPPSILLSAIAAVKAMNQTKLGKKISDISQNIEETDTRFQYPGEDTDRLFRADYNHVTSKRRGQGETCAACDASQEVTRLEREYDYPHIHYGIIASGSQVIKDGIKRDKISSEHGVLCFEMEAAGLMNDFPCAVIRGISDYSDGHKNKRWQSYAALVAAIYAKELLLQIPAASNKRTGCIDEDGERIKNLNFIIPFHMPLPRNDNFCGREEELSKVHNYFIKSTRPMDTPFMFALTGTGGMGKTQIAVEYTYRHHRNHTAIFWVSAASEDTIRTSFIRIMQRIVEEQTRIVWPESTPDYDLIGSKLSIPGLLDERGIFKTEPKIVTLVIIREALFHWLQLPGNNKWLLIFDNADDLEGFDIQNHFPNHGGGAILITSRRPEISYGSAKQADLDGLDKEAAVKLLLRLARMPESTEAIKQEVITLVEKLGFMPLAISHAGCFMYETKASAQEYLSYYDKRFMEIQKKPRFGWNYHDTVATTWEISLSAIEKQDREAALMLLACSYLNPEEISESLWEDTESDESFTLQNKNRILLLASYSLVKVVRFGVFSIHPVVHSWARERLKGQEQLRIINDVVGIIGKALCQPGSEECNRWYAMRPLGHAKFASIAAHLGHLHRYVTPRLSELLEHHKRQFSAIEGITFAFFWQDKYDEALQWNQQLLNSSESIFGKEHPRTAHAVTSMIVVLNKQGKSGEAMQWCHRALVTTKDPDRDHESILYTFSNIALTFSLQKEYEEAIRLWRRLLTAVKIFDKNHQLIPSILNNIGLALVQQGQPDEAIRWYQQLATDEDEHCDDKFQRITNIALAFQLQGRYDKAIQWYQRAIAGREKILGVNDPSVFHILNNMALVFFRQGKYDKALQWFQRALISKEKTLGKHHPSTAGTVDNIASVFESQGKHDECLEWRQRALSSIIKTAGEGHPTAFTITCNIVSSISQRIKHTEPIYIVWPQQGTANGEKLRNEAVERLDVFIQEISRNT